MARTNKDSAPKEKKTRWYKQIWQVLQMTRKVQPSIAWILPLIFFGIIAVAWAIGFFLLHHALYLTLISIPIALVAALFILMRRAERAAYTQIEGQQGAAYAALGQIRRGWSFEEDPVAADGRTGALVFRGLGKPGVVLVGEGQPGQLKRLFAKETKKVARVAPNVPVHTLEVGQYEGQLALRKVPRAVVKLRPSLTAAEVAQVKHRLEALPGIRQSIPKGIDPLRARPDRSSIRGH